MKNVYTAALLTSVSFCFFSPLPAMATEPEICEIRAAILGSVAQERDKGVSKQKVMKTIGKKFSAMGGYVDLIYDQMKDMSPKEVASLIKYSCLSE